MYMENVKLTASKREWLFDLDNPVKSSLKLNKTDFDLVSNIFRHFKTFTYEIHELIYVRLE